MRISEIIEAFNQWGVELSRPTIRQYIQDNLKMGEDYFVKSKKQTDKTKKTRVQIHVSETGYHKLLNLFGIGDWSSDNGTSDWDEMDTPAIREARRGELR